MAEMVPVADDLAIEAVAALARETWERHYTSIIGAAQVRYMLAKFQSPSAIKEQIEKGSEYYKVCEKGSNVGYFALVPNRENGRMMLSKIYILADYQGRGLGRAVIAFAEKRCVETGHRTLWLTVNKNNVWSIAFYERAGFKKESSVVSDIGGGFVMDDYIMSKRVRR